MTKINLTPCHGFSTNRLQIITEMLDEIISTMGNSESPKTESIPRDKVIFWMRSNDIETLGALYALLADQRHRQRIDPPLSLTDTHGFVLPYLERCFLENPDGQWSDSRYSAGWNLLNWFTQLWANPEVPREMLRELKQWLANLYKEGDDTVRKCIVDATLEHLFENPNIAEYFEDWKNDPLLDQAYRSALIWSQKAGGKE